MKKGFFTLFLLAATICGCQIGVYGASPENNLTSQGRKVVPSGEIIRETRHVASFNGINTGSGFRVIIVHSNRHEVEIKTDRNMLPYIDVSVKNNILHIKKLPAVNKNNFNNVSTIIYVKVPALTSLKLGEGSDVSVEETFAGDKMSVSVATGSKFTGSFDYNKFDISVSSGSNVDLHGRAVACKVVVNSGSNVDMSDFKCIELHVNISSGSRLSAYASKSIKGNVSSGASLIYDGDPANVNINKSSGATVRKI